MKDPLEDFVSQNRGAFDDKTPSENVWRNIQKGVGTPKSTVWQSVVLWRAAAIIFMALSGYLLLPAHVKPSPSAKADVATNGFKAVEEFYIQQISEKVEMIDEFEKNDGLNGFTQDFQQLEAMYMVLKEEMKSSPSEKVKDALVLNLLVRIDLLNQRLHKLETEYKKEKGEQEDSV